MSHLDGNVNIRQFGDAVETGQNGTWETGPSAKDIMKSDFEKQMADMMAGNMAVDTGNMGGAEITPSTPIAIAQIQIDENKPPASPPGDDSSDEEIENKIPAPPTPIITQQFKEANIDEEKPPATPPQSSSDSDDED